MSFLFNLYSRFPLPGILVTLTVCCLFLPLGYKCLKNKYLFCPWLYWLFRMMPSHSRCATNIYCIKLNKQMNVSFIFKNKCAEVKIRKLYIIHNSITQKKVTFSDKVMIHLRCQGYAGVNQEGGRRGEEYFRGKRTCKALWWRKC